MRSHRMSERLRKDPSLIVSVDVVEPGDVCQAKSLVIVGPENDPGFPVANVGEVAPRDDDAPVRVQTDPADALALGNDQR